MSLRNRVALVTGGAGALAAGLLYGWRRMEPDGHRLSLQ